MRGSTFYLRNKPAAYATDASRGTTPVWQSLANLDQAKSNYGAIVYNKAPGILKQLNYLVGDTTFKRGLRTYLRAHAYGNATWQRPADVDRSRPLLDLGACRPVTRAATDGTERPQRPTDPQWRARSHGLGPRLHPAPWHAGDHAAGHAARLTSWQLELSQAPAQALSDTRPWPIRTQVLIVDSAGTSRRRSGAARQRALHCSPSRPTRRPSSSPTRATRRTRSSTSTRRARAGPSSTSAASPIHCRRR